jgi:hypothetical protein
VIVCVSSLAKPVNALSRLEGERILAGGVSHRNPIESRVRPGRGGGSVAIPAPRRGESRIPIVPVVPLVPRFTTGI